ncbi:MAG: DNA translocase FtsK [Candidatus Izimaplasma sp.]|nr:DNA translocase FtsK [Candidatus Izimaplasma bacterium]
MMFFKRKKKLVVTERSKDTVPFEIPEIIEVKAPYESENFVSPIFGRKVKDDVVIPNPFTREGDVDLRFDSFRTKPKMTKEEMVKRYGTAYPEFDLVKGRNLKEAMDDQTKRKETKSRANHTAPLEEEQDTRSSTQQYSKEKRTNITDFFDQKQQDKTEQYHKEEPENKEDVSNESVEIREPSPKPHQESVTTKPSTKKYKLPTIDLLQVPKKQVTNNGEWLNKQIDILNQTFEEFNIGATVKKYTKGPTVTRYEIALDKGVNVKKITGIADNIKMALAAKEIRLEAPIPGKNTVGIEVPNEKADIVHFYDVLRKDAFINASDPLTVALGIDIDGIGVFTSIRKMPHGLVAGATGSGKSVCINTILMSLLFRYTPDELKLLLIDPKMVELSVYNDLPHLITPVITDPKVAMAGLKWVVDEMDNRFDTFAKYHVRDIVAYNKYAETDELEQMPYIVIVVDELADLMMVSSSNVEDAIMRLTQKARACGIHLIIATQRPSTDVVKGTIKSNIPTRIAFMVSSHVDSMTIIDSSGADKLLGRGDMLFVESGKPHHRVQGAFISDEDIRTVTNFIRKQRKSDYLFDEDSLIRKVTTEVEADDLIKPVAYFVVDEAAASINKISKEFKIGFNRAQNIVETLFDMGIVSDNVGSRARDVLVTREELDELFN